MNEIKLQKAADILEITRRNLLDMHFEGLFLAHFREGVFYTKMDYLRYYYKTYGQYFAAGTMKKIRIHQKLNL